MWKPEESLDDYKVSHAPQIISEPPPPVSLQRTGEVEVLEPLARPEVRAGLGGFRPGQPLWFRRLLVVGSGAIVFFAMVLVSAILVGIGDRAAGPDVATNAKLDDMLTQPQELFSFDLSIPLTLLPGTGDIVRSNARRRHAQSTIVNKPRRQLRPPLQPQDPNFVPTTLVIYAENGVIMTRIEPWFQSADKPRLTFNN